MTVGANKDHEPCLIYVALTKIKEESYSFLRKQLKMLHCYIITAGTRQIMTQLRNV